MINGQNNTLKSQLVTVMIASFLLIIPLGLIGVLVLSGLTYTVPAIMAVSSFTLSVVLSIRQKSLSISSLVAFIVGCLFLASSVIEFGFSGFTQYMATHDQMAVSGIIHPHRVSHALASIGVGITLIYIGLNNDSAKILDEGHVQYQKRKPISLFQISIGALFLLLGIFEFFGGLQPL